MQFAYFESVFESTQFARATAETLWIGAHQTSNGWISTHGGSLNFHWADTEPRSNMHCATTSLTSSVNFFGFILSDYSKYQSYTCSIALKIGCVLDAN
jgi:hypothetical protein